VAIELLHVVGEVQALFQAGDYFKARKACEECNYHNRLEEVKAEFVRRVDTANAAGLDNKDAHRAADEMEIEVEAVKKASERLATLHAASNKKPAAQLRRVWDAADKDNSGDLDIGEVKEVLRMMGVQRITKAGLETVMSQIDADGSGEVDFEEFETWYWSLDTTEQEKMLGK
jgi:calmodulin